ncbi:hypothetical protein HBH26_09810 [Sphingomonas sp. 36D10-4-7]|jgi:hypothetical protein|uniref:Peptidase C14 caspase domain-containing protein n=1 Tax=Sphingomonas corticis TaxID=2722791 RepID=A0ABX1CPY1_9SPHN|nr:hypothetical protein [Sphingomonas corticis]
MGSTWRRLAAGVAASLFITALVSPVAAETRALLVGVWKFESPMLKDLAGPEHDLAAMETLVRAEGARDVTVLRNDQVSRTTVETAIHALGLRSKPGDWIVLYYSGHGAEADAAVRGTRDGDRDQFLPLARFDPADPERYIVDKDFYAWLSRYVPGSVKVLMMADACHSGTLNRSADARAFRFTPRLGFRAAQADFTLTARPAPRFAAVLGGSGGTTVDRADLPNLIYLAAARDEQLAWEFPMPVEGAPPRGLLTYNVEQGLTTRGPDGRSLAADLDGNGSVEVGELAQYVATQVRSFTADRQEPQAFIPPGGEGLKLFARVEAAAPPETAPLPAIFAADPAAQPMLAAAGAPWRVAARAEAADFVYDRTAGVLLRRSGDRVAQDVATTAQLRGVLEKWDTIDRLRPLLDETRVRLTLGPGAFGTRYVPGAQVDASVTAAAAAGSTTGASLYLTVFNLASDGTVQALYPSGQEGDGRIEPGARLPLIENRVTPPYGTDHVVALLTPQAPVALRAVLRAVEGQRASGRLVAPLKQAVVAAGAAGGLSVAELYTGR